MKLYLVIISVTHKKNGLNIKPGQVEVGSNTAQVHSSSLLEVISGHYMSQFTRTVYQKF